MSAASPQGAPPAPRPARTFVLSDAHGHPELIQQALDHGGFTPGEDAFIYAGDLLDRGPDPGGCLELVERYATEVLVGNHELAVLLDFDMCGTEPQSRHLRQVLLDRVVSSAPVGAAPAGAMGPQGASPAAPPLAAPAPVSAAPAGATGCQGAAPQGAAPSLAAPAPWKVATCVDGVLVTHAGVSTSYQEALDHDCHGDPVQLAAYLNGAFTAAVRRELETGDWDEDGILGRSGPLWYRPLPWAEQLPLQGVRQVAGHTPPEPGLEARGFWMVDPCVWMSMMDASWRVRYAVIEDGTVTVVERQLRERAA